MTDFTGVAASFDKMASKHTQAARRLEELAQALHRELQSAGLDTSLAARFRELAGRVTTQAEDLRRGSNWSMSCSGRRSLSGRAHPREFP